MFGKIAGGARKLGGLAKKLAPIAPVLSAAIPYGGPVTKAALKLVASVTGGDPDDPSSVEAGLDNASSADLVEISKLNKRFEADMKRMDVDLEKHRIEDVQDARRAHGDSWVPAALALMLNGALVVALLVPLFREVDPTALSIALPILAGSAVGASQYWTGSSQTQDYTARNGKPR